MASVRWQGGAAAVAQVQTFAIGGTWEVGDIVRVVIGSKKYDYSVTSATIATWVPLFVTAFNALSSTDYPELAEITASGSTSLTFTCDTAGRPFTITLTPLESDGSAADAQTIEGAGTATTGTAATAPTGPAFWSEARNWSGGAVPVSTDDVYIEASDDDIKYGLAQSAVTLSSLNIAASFTGTIGLPEVNSDGSADYYEYRSQYLAISATTLNIGTGEGRGSGRIKINVGTNQTAVNVRATGTGLDQDVPALLWKGTHAGNVMNATAGSIGVAWFGGETATLATLTVGYVQSRETDVKLIAGAGLSLTTLSMSGGQVTLAAGLTTITKNGGTLVLLAGSVTTWTDDQGTSAYLGTGTITTLNVGSGCSFEFTRDMRARTVTNTNLYRGSSTLDPFGTVTFTNAPRAVRCSLTEVTLDVGKNRTYAIGS